MRERKSAKRLKRRFARPLVKWLKNPTRARSKRSTKSIEETNGRTSIATGAASCCLDGSW
jgi:hypothetical protein